MTKALAFLCGGILVAIASVPASAQDKVSERIKAHITRFAETRLEMKGSVVVYKGNLEVLNDLRVRCYDSFAMGDTKIVSGSAKVKIQGAPAPVDVRWNVGRYGNVDTHPNGYPASVSGAGVNIAISGSGSEANRDTPSGAGGDATASGGDLNIAIAGGGGMGRAGVRGGNGGKATATAGRGGRGYAIGGWGGKGSGIDPGDAAMGGIGGAANVTGDGEAYGGVGGDGGRSGWGHGGEGGAGGAAAVTGKGKAVGGNGGNGGDSVVGGGGLDANIQPAGGGAGGGARGGRECPATNGTPGKPGKVEVK